MGISSHLLNLNLGTDIKSGEHLIKDDLICLHIPILSSLPAYWIWACAIEKMPDH